MTSSKTRSSRSPSLKVSIESSDGDRYTFQFERTFRIGRTGDCEISLPEDCVSRTHAEIAFEDGQWIIRDLQSSNGTYVNGQRIESAPVGQRTTVRLGKTGPQVSLELESAAGKEAGPNETQIEVSRYVEHYFGGQTNDENVGQHTLFVRQAFKRVQTKQKKKYRSIIAALALLAFGVGLYALQEHEQARRQRALAENLFYNMKSLDLDIAHLQSVVLDTHSQLGMEEIKKYQGRRKDMAKNYDHFLDTLHVYDSKMTEQDRLIVRVTRIFGECELGMPAGFVAEVHKYIKKWQTSDRLTKAIQLANERGYTSNISKNLLDQGLPEQFFYLALQESNFDPYISGPMTRKGIAKGMWQFIPETAIKYGLRVGPLADQRRPDPGDDRHHYDLETRAAARYLKDLYSTDAQASGFLVMASYNWGEDQVLPLIRSMPANPKDRNFWQLLAKHREQIPRETYDYVFYIASAAVIGENPRLFGFPFDNPLAHEETTH